MEIKINYNNIDWLIIIDDYDYTPEDEIYPESIELLSYYLEINPKGVNEKLTELINNQLTESNRLCEHIFDLYNNEISAKAIDIQLNGVLL